MSKYKKLSDEELVSLIREKGDTTAEKVLVDKYTIYCRGVAFDTIVDYNFRYKYLFIELTSCGLQALAIAIKAYNGDFQLYNYWRTIARNLMIELIDEEKKQTINQFSFDADSRLLEQEVFNYRRFCSSDDSGLSLIGEIRNFLLHHRLRFREKDVAIFIDYITGTPQIKLAKIYHLSIPTVYRKIEMMKYVVIKEMFGD